MDIFVGSLSFKLKESELREAFEKFGEVSSAKIIIDKITRQSKGFGFVEMPDDEQAKLAISELNGVEMYGRPLVVNESQKKERTPGDQPRTSSSSDSRSSDTRSSGPGASDRSANFGRNKPAGGGGGYSGGGNSGGGYGGGSGGYGGKPKSDYGRGGRDGGDYKKGGGSKRGDSRDRDDW
ncbi:RNA-binding protein [Dyadobacter sp. CY356]|uniref:RNA recognition motif domain-containing protein n=1 Tax=Dyadobacter sp. CY356 TaxID=2906442 RepID=UPI001F48EEB6|nr:RNA-binding protein [Dyadobacter sp. CY356]MCF0058206.1 RNA-binding protein [Dyadobacter sp. CY356]